MSDRDLEPLPPELTQLLDQERTRAAPDPSERMRVLSRVHGTLGLIAAGGGGGAAGGAGTNTAPPPAASGSAASAADGSVGGAAAPTGLLTARPLAMTLAGFLLGTVVGAAGYARIHPPAPVEDLDAPPQMATSVAVAPPSAPTEPSPVVVAQPAPEVSAVAIPGPAPSARAGASAAAASASGDAHGRDVDLAAERALLEIARTALARGQSARALEALQRHSTEFPRGRLGEERDVLWIQSLLAAGRGDEARVRAERFKKAYPKSMLLPAIDGALSPKR